MFYNKISTMSMSTLFPAAVRRLSSGTAAWPTKAVEISTCGKLYDSWRVIAPSYQRAPIGGLQLKLDYLDTKQVTATADDAPVVLMVHGGAGSCNDFTPLITRLVGSGARVLAPNLPDYSLTIETDGLFKHSADEKTEVLKDFLSAIDVRSVDMLVTHSGGCYPGLLLHEQAIKLRAIALLNPAGHRRVKSMRPAWFCDTVVRLYQHPIGRAVCRAIVPTVHKLFNPTLPGGLDTSVLLATTMRYSGNYRLPAQFESLRAQGTPLLLVVGENDMLIEKSISFEQAEMLGAEVRHFDRFDASGALIQKAPPSDRLNVLCFDGGHSCYRKYANVVGDAIVNLMNKVEN